MSFAELIKQENDELRDFTAYPTVICNEKYLPYIHRENFKPKGRRRQLIKKTYAKPSIYYCGTEDLSNGIQLKRLFRETHNANPCRSNDMYSEDGAENQYLSSTPVSFIILGKPEIGQTDVAKLLAEHWRCVFISPDSVIQEEITAGTRAGRCIEYNLRTGRAVGPEVLIRLVEKRVRSETAKHRGFVISGFPMLPNIYYREDPISSESAIFNVEEIFEELLPGEDVSTKPGSVSLAKESEASATGEKSTSELEDITEEEDIKKSLAEPKEMKLEEDIDLGPSNIAIINITESFHRMCKPDAQLEFLCSLLQTPFIIIYVMCSNLEVVHKRDKYRFDVQSAEEITLQPNQPKLFMETQDAEENEEVYFDESQMKRFVKLPAHFKDSIYSQLRVYRCFVHKPLEIFVLHHNPEHFMKVDGRLSAVNTFNSIWMRLKTLAFQTVLIPEKLVEQEIAAEFAGDANISKYKGKSPESVYEDLRSQLIIGPMYKWQLSNWGFKCPVALKEGKILKGDPEFSVKFMNKIFFLSNEESLLKFYRNPRSYLLPVSPQPNCRIWIMGPQLSGKTLVAKCLSLLFNSCVLRPTDLEQEYKAKKEFDYIEKLRTAAITEALVTLNKFRQMERETKLLKWKDKVCELFLDVIALKEGRSLRDIEPGEESLFLRKLKSETELRRELAEMKLPSMSELSLINSLLTDSEKLAQYTPKELLKPVKPAVIFDPFVTQHVNNVIDNVEIPDMSLTIDEKVDMFQTAIQRAEDDFYNQFQRRGGWIIDDMTPDLELIMALDIEYLPDDIICLKDDDPENTFLQEKYAKKDFSSFKEYRKFFADMKKYSIAECAHSFLSSDSRINFINYIASEIENLTMSIIYPEESLEFIKAERNKLFLSELNEYYTNWLNVKNYLTDMNAEYIIEINIAYKTAYKILEDTVLALEDRYRRIATVMTAEDRDREFADFGGIDLGMGMDEEQEFGEGGPIETVDSFSVDRRMGDTDVYCPVALDRYFVLWKGNEKFAAQFEQKTYFLSTKENLDKFIANPRFFLKNKPFEKFPPPRICIIGVSGSGKTTLAKSIANNFGLFYLNFDSLVFDILYLFSKDAVDNILLDDSDTDRMLALHSKSIENLKSYIENDVPIPNDLFKGILSRYWFQKPYVDVGFVLDNFPRRPSDLSVMVLNYFIPEIVIELHASQELIRERMFSPLFNEWKTQITEKQLLKSVENEDIFNNWQERRFEECKFLANQKREDRRVANIEKHKRLLTTPIDSRTSLELMEAIAEESLDGEDWFYDSVQEREDLDEVNKFLDEIMPEPKFDDKWESDEEATERINMWIDLTFSRNIQYLDAVRDVLKAANIDFYVVDTINKPADKVLNEVVHLTDGHKFRNNSLVERVYEITMDVAENLLEQGYYFLSRFGRTCPVQVYEKINPFQMYLIDEYELKTFPLIHRRYIYFVYGEESRDKFKHDPLKYIANNNCTYPLLPVRIAIVGPPKCGKSYLAERFRKAFGLNVITRGKAIRYIQKQIPFCNLAQNVKNILSKGWSLTYEMTAKCVESLTLDGSSLSQGYILDGFPNSREELEYYEALGIVPHMVLNIDATVKKIEECSAMEEDRLQTQFSLKLIKYKTHLWKQKEQLFRIWMHCKYQNIYFISNDDSKWHLWVRAKEIVFPTWRNFQQYLLDKEFEQVLPLMSLCITPYEFYERQGLFKNYCLLCYHHDGILNQAPKFPNRSLVVQYRNYLLYICAKHFDDFLFNAHEYFLPENVIDLPEDLPVIVSEYSNPVYENGFCVVSFWDSQPHRVLHEGYETLAVFYKGMYYLFCSKECLLKFMRNPFRYSDILINYQDEYPLTLIGLRDIPALGYLEQCVGRLLIGAVVQTELHRPILVGLNVRVSAILNIALYLKSKNPKLPKEVKPLYDGALEIFHTRRIKLKKTLEFFKNHINPNLCMDSYKVKPKVQDETGGAVGVIASPKLTKTGLSIVDMIYKNLGLAPTLSDLEFFEGG